MVQEQATNASCSRSNKLYSDRAHKTEHPPNQVKSLPSLHPAVLGLART